MRPASLMVAALALALAGAADAGVARRGLTPASERVRAAAATDLRAAPDEDSRVTARINPRSPVDVMGRRGRWVEVRFHGRHGWVLRTALEGAVPTDRAGSGDRSSKANRARGMGPRPRPVAEEPVGAAGTARSRDAADAASARDAAAGLAAPPPPRRAKFSRSHLREDGEGAAATTAAAPDLDEDEVGAPAAAAPIAPAAQVGVLAPPDQGRPRGVALETRAAAGYTSGGMQHKNGGGRDALSRFGGPSAEVGVAVGRRLGRRWTVAASGDGAFVQVGEVSYRSAEVAVADTAARALAVAGTASLRYGRRSFVGLTAGYRYERFDVARASNMAALPSEIVRGPTIGALGSLALTDDLRLDGSLEALIAGKRQQTPGLEDGARGATLAGQASGELGWEATHHLALTIGVRVGLATTRFSGPSSREPGVSDARRSDQRYSGVVGVRFSP